jgi:hypothetical protein
MAKEKPIDKEDLEKFHKGLDSIFGKPKDKETNNGKGKKQADK